MALTNSYLASVGGMQFGGRDGITYGVSTKVNRNIRGSRFSLEMKGLTDPQHCTDTHIKLKEREGGVERDRHIERKRKQKREREGARWSHTEAHRPEKALRHCARPLLSKYGTNKTVMA